MHGDLPAAMVVTAPCPDEAVVGSVYGGQSWASDDQGVRVVLGRG